MTNHFMSSKFAHEIYSNMTGIGSYTHKCGILKGLRIKSISI